MIGAREHYALPLALHKFGSLARLYTDVWAGPLLRRAKFGPAALRSLAARHHATIPSKLVVDFTGHTVIRRLCDTLGGAPLRSEEQYVRFIRDGRDFALRVNRHLERNWKRLRPTGLLGYDTACLETQQLLASRGVPSIVDQIDAAQCEDEIVRQEAIKWPGWQALPGQIPDIYFRRLDEEWRLATRVIVNSHWSRDALIRQGVPPNKIAVVPLCYGALPGLPPRREPGSESKVTVLWLGQVILRKGIQYLIEAARLLVDQPIRFKVVGPIGISRLAIASAPPNMYFVGPATRDRISDVYKSADLFVLPTLSDGFAITQLEAMAHGLPVIATPNCGEVVTHGDSGFIVPPGDATALAAAISELVANRALLRDMARAAQESVPRFSLDNVATTIARVINELDHKK